MDVVEAITKLNNIEVGDTETSHCLADNILLDFLKDNGYTKLAEAWEDLNNREGGFWYA